MAKTLYYFSDTDSEVCYTIDYFYEQLNDNDLTQMQIYPAIRMTGEPFFWCSIICDCFECGENTCGKFNCNDYKPRNGKNGRCYYHRNCYTPSEISVTIYNK
jgi:hypothetical protein